MASLQQDPSGNFHVCFRFGGKRFKRSLKTTSQRKADAACTRLDENIRLVAGGLPIGSAAPSFELPDLAGVRHALSEFRGREVLLIFFNPQCGYCAKMADDLAALPLNGANGRALPAVVTTGNAEENLRFIEQHGIHCVVLLQKEMEVAIVRS